MKILHISRTMGQGGAEKIVYQLCKDNTIQEQYVISTGGQYVDELQKCGVKHYTMPDIDKKNPFLMLICLFKIWGVVREENIDVIHTHHRMAAFYARIVSILTGKKCVYTAHNVFYNRKKLSRISFKGSKIVAVGDGVKKNLVEEFEIPEKDIVVVHNTVQAIKSGTDNQELAELKKQGKCLIGTIGRITKQKGMDVFLKAMSPLIAQNKNIVAVIVGDGEDRESIKQLAKELDIMGNVVFLGYQRNVLDIIGQLEFAVLASRWEGLPLTPIEVFSQGKTIVASDISGNNEVITDKVTGLLCKMDDVADFSHKIGSLIEDDTLKTKLEVNAKECYNEKYEYSIFIDKYNAVYESCK